jgi:Right handed beta helix region
MTPFSLSAIRTALSALVFSAFVIPVGAQTTIDFRPLLDNAVRKGLPLVVIPPGTYHLAPGIEVRDAKKLKIVADKVTLVCTRLSRAISFDHCADVTLRGLTVDYDPLPFTQGKVTAVASDLSSIDIKLDAGYPRQPYSRIDLCDPKTRFRKRGMPFMWGTRAEMIGDDIVRIHLGDIGKIARIGDLASLSTGPGPGGVPHAISVGDCSGMVFDHVTVFTAPGMGILEAGGEGGMKYTHCRIVPGPKPPGATEDRLLSTTWDAIQTKTTHKGPDVENCEILSAGDDSWSVQSSDYVVVALDGRKAVLAFRDIYCDGPELGNRLMSSLDSLPVTVSTRTSIDLSHLALPDDIRARMKETKPWDYWHVGPRALEITTKEPFPYKVGDSVYCPDEQCNGFVFRNNKLHSAGRILVKASDGLIEGNDIDQCHSGVTVCAEVPAEAASGIENVIIRNNHITGTGYYCPLWNSSQAGSVSITAESPHGPMHPAGAFRNIVINGNRFDDICGPSLVVSSTQQLKVTNNTFTKVMTAPPGSTGGRVGIDPGALIWLDQCVDVKMSRNNVYSPGPYLKELVAGRGLANGVLEAARAGIVSAVGAASSTP